jgi:hypothetical protein
MRTITATRLFEEVAQRIYRANAWFFRGRYQLLASLIGLAPEGNAHSPRGTVIIQVDGLGHSNLREAIRRGYLPFTKRLLERGQYRLFRWRCGLAADTPPIQSGLMYGTADGVAGFYWWDRKHQSRIVGVNPYHMRRVQAELAESAGVEGLLAGGSSYSNIMSGGARYSVITIAGGDRHWFTPGQALMRALAILSLNPGKAVRFIFDSAWELLQEMEDRVFVNAMDRPRILEGAFPVVRLLLNVLAREVVTAGTRVDMLRGVNVIFSCYIGYDVVAHHSGPLSRNSLRVLKGIDGSIRKLFLTLPWTERRYDIVILSDHGTTPCRSVEEAFDSDFSEWIERWWRQGAQATPVYRAHRRRVRRWLHRPQKPASAHWLGRLAGEVAQRSSGWARTWGRIGAWTLELGSAGTIKLGERFLEEEQDTDAPRVTVINCGPLSQIWIKEVDRHLDLSEVEALCPGFLDAVAEHPGVQVVVGRQGDTIEVRGRSGKAVLRMARTATETQDLVSGPPVVLHVEGKNPLSIYEEPDIAARQVAAFASMNACGDVICLGALFRPDTLREATPGAAGQVHTYTFEKQLGTHAALGGDQAYPFLMVPAHVSFDPSPIVTASQMYPILKQIVDGPTEEVDNQATAPPVGPVADSIGVV